MALALSVMPNVIEETHLVISPESSLAPARSRSHKPGSCEICPLKSHSCGCKLRPPLPRGAPRNPCSRAPFAWAPALFPAFPSSGQAVFVSSFPPAAGL